MGDRERQRLDIEYARADEHRLRKKSSASSLDIEYATADELRLRRKSSATSLDGRGSSSAARNTNGKEH